MRKRSRSQRCTFLAASPPSRCSTSVSSATLCTLWWMLTPTRTWQGGRGGVGRDGTGWAQVWAGGQQSAVVSAVVSACPMQTCSPEIHGSTAWHSVAQRSAARTTLGVNTRPSWSVSPTVIRRSTISSSAELEGAQTCTEPPEGFPLVRREGLASFPRQSKSKQHGTCKRRRRMRATQRRRPCRPTQLALTQPCQRWQALPARGPWGPRWRRCAAGCSGAAARRRRWSLPALAGRPPPCNAVVVQHVTPTMPTGRLKRGQGLQWKGIAAKPGPAAATPSQTSTHTPGPLTNPRVHAPRPLAWGLAPPAGRAASPATPRACAQRSSSCT